MMMKNPFYTLLIALTLAVGASRAEGSLIEFTFGGQLEQVIGMPPAPWDGVGVGSNFSVSYIFDTETPDLDTSFQDGRYAVESLSVTMDGVALAAGSAEIVLRRTNPFQHRYMVNFSDLPFGANGGITLTGVMALDSDNLPTTIDLNDWFGRGFEVVQSANGESSEVHGIIDSFSSRVVPTPGILIMFLLPGLISPSRRRNTT